MHWESIVIVLAFVAGVLAFDEYKIRKRRRELDRRWKEIEAKLEDLTEDELDIM